LYEVIKRQGKTKASESAIKLTVYKADKGEEEAEAPAQPAAEDKVADAPIKRESTRKAAPESADDVSDIVKKWAKK
jgi:hypothetical protein